MTLADEISEEVDKADITVPSDYLDDGEPPSAVAVHLTKFRERLTALEALAERVLSSNEWLKQEWTDLARKGLGR